MRKKLRNIPKLGIAAFIGFVAGLPGHAGAVITETATMSVTAHVTGSCSVTVYQDVNFGTIDSYGDASAAENDVRVFCSNALPYSNVSVTMDGGLHYDSGLRRMQNTSSSADYIPYGLYEDQVHSVDIDPNTSYPLVDFSQAGIGRKVAHLFFYPYIPPLNPSGDGAPPGDYLDTVTVTLTYDPV